MSGSKRLNAGVTVLGLGLGVMGLAGIPPLAAVAVPLLVVGGGACLTGAWFCFDASVPQVREWFLSLGKADYTCRTIQKKQIPDVRQFCLGFFEDHEFTAQRLMEKWYDQNRELFFVVEQIRTRRNEEVRKVVGYFCLVPLNAEASALVEDGQLNAMYFTTGHILRQVGRRRAQASSVYLASVCAKGFTAMGATLKALEERLDEEGARGTPVVYTRPVTPRGLDLALRHGFVPVRPEECGLEHIYRRSLKAPPAGSATTVPARRSGGRRGSTQRAAGKDDPGERGAGPDDAAPSGPAGGAEHHDPPPSPGEAEGRTT
ncbi:MAG TPA: hypothetical protein VFU47_05385 [Armatimonadota bacterium]|nr:hypothetical protein [Armatimonadota bacterium]